MFTLLKRYLANARYRAVGMSFFLLSILFAFWITRIPEVKVNLQLSEGDLGTALFFAPFGAIVSMVLITRLIRLLGEGRSTALSLFFYGGAMVLPLLAVDLISLCFVLFIVGFTMGWVDISMNAVANTIEKEEEVKIMNTSHGFFSLGGIFGGIVGGYLAGTLLSGSTQMIGGWVLVILVSAFFIYPQLKMVSDGSNKDPVQFRLPGKPLIGLAFVAFCIMLSEGAITDWSTVYLSQTLKSSPLVAGLGFATFSTMMTLGRFNGDYFIERFGSFKVVQAGLGFATLGLVLLFFQWIPLAIVGFALIGIGYSSVAPILFSESSKKEGIAPAVGLASVATTGYFGFLLGPVLIGWVAEGVGLTLSFGILLVLTLLAVVLVGRKGVI